jgi:hypothetical protein
MSCEQKIPDKDSLYRKCHWKHWDDVNEVPEYGAVEFDKSDDTVSVFWSALIRSEDVLPQFRSLRAIQEDGVIAIRAGQARAGSDREGNRMEVNHTPHFEPECHVSHSSIVPASVPFNRTRAYDLLLEGYEVIVPVQRRRSLSEKPASG